MKTVKQMDGIRVGGKYKFSTVYRGDIVIKVLRIFKKNYGDEWRWEVEFFPSASEEYTGNDSILVDNFWKRATADPLEDIVSLIEETSDEV